MTNTEKDEVNAEADAIIADRDADHAEVFRRAAEVIRGQWRNVEDARKDGRPDGVNAETWAAQILSAQLCHVLEPLWYKVPTNEDPAGRVAWRQGDPIENLAQVIKTHEGG